MRRHPSLPVFVRAQTVCGYVRLSVCVSLNFMTRGIISLLPLQVVMFVCVCWGWTDWFDVLSSRYLSFIKATVINMIIDIQMTNVQIIPQFYSCPQLSEASLHGSRSLNPPTDSGLAS